MQASDPNMPGYHLPTVINPPDSLCFTVKVPNDQWHIAAFLGALFELTQWISWQRDSGKHGKDAAAVWRDIWTDLAAQSCDLKPTALNGAEIEDFMPLRVDCDCNVFVTCCDGTEKQILTSAQVQALIAGGNTTGAPQPAPGGGCQSYDLINFGNTPAIIPVPLNTGDVLTISQVKGASSIDGLVWRCAADGLTFFAAECVGFPATDPTDRMPANPQGIVVILLNGTYYAFAGGTFTVPGGVTNKQASIWLNWPLATTIYGSIQATVEVCNNALGPWTHTFDFRLSPGPFQAKDGNRAVWTAGVGWSPGVITQTQITTDPTLVMPSGMNTTEVDFLLSSGGTAEVVFFDGTSYHFDDAGITSPHAYAHAITPGWFFEFGGYSGADTIETLTVKGTGVNPF